MSTEITAKLVNELRQRTSEAMMDCKKALVETNGDIEAAVEYLRKKGQAKAVKKADRITAEGAVKVAQHGDLAAMIEVNCETDFVARDENFKQFVDLAIEAAIKEHCHDIAQLSAISAVEDARKALVAKIGENITLRRLYMVHAHPGEVFGTYVHSGRIGVVVVIKGNVSEDFAKGIAMHIAASNPQVVNPSDVSKEFLDKEKEIFMAQAQAQGQGKPAEIIEKMVQGRISKLLEEVSLLRQAYVRDPNQKVGDVLQKEKAEVVSFVRYELGEGIEKKVDNFVEEVMAQVQGGS
jgi:elongation factor Ts